MKTLNKFFGILALIGVIRQKSVLFSIAILLCISGLLQAQVVYNFGQIGGLISSNSTSGTNPAIFNRYPTSPTNVKFFYGISSGANSILKGSNSGLARLGDSTEAQATAGNGATEFCKFGILRYSAQGTLFSYSKFDISFAGDSLAGSASDAGTWYFFLGDGYNSSGSTKFMDANSTAKVVTQCGVALRWVYGTNGGLTFSYYDYSGMWRDVTTYPWAQKKKYSVEVYANTDKNSSNSYTRQGITYNLLTKTMDIWVNNVKIASGVNTSQYDNQNGDFHKMDSFCWYGEGSNNAWIFVDNTVASDVAIATYAYYTIKPANNTVLDLSLYSNWTTSNTGIGGTQPTAFSKANTTWFIRNYASVSGVSFTLSSGNLDSAGSNSQIELGDSGQVAVYKIPAGKKCLYDLDIMRNGDLVIETTTLPYIRSTDTLSTVEYNNGDNNITYPLYYNLKILSGTKTIGVDYIVENKTTVGGGMDTATFIVPSNFILLGKVDVSKKGKLVIKNTTAPKLGVLSAGSTVEYSAVTGGMAPGTQTTEAGVTYANLTINNTDGVVLGGNNTVSEILTMTAGNLSIGSYTLTLNGTVTGSGATITGSTSSNLTIGGTGALGTLTFTNGARSLNNFTFDRQSSGTATLGSYLNVEGTLTLTNGILNSNTISDSLTLGTSSSSPGTLVFTQTGPNYTSWINGKFQRYVAAGTNTILFPVGSGSYWEGVKLIYSGNTSTGGSLSAVFTIGNFVNIIAGYLTDASNYTIDRYSRYGYWAVKNNAVSGSYEIDLDAYNFTGLSTDPLQREKLRIIKRVDNTQPWTLQGSHQTGTGISTSQWTVKRTGLSAFSDFTLGAYSSDNRLDDAPLPVSLQSFTSIVKGRNLTLNWVTVSELNNAGFNIERKALNGTWSKIGFVQGKGNIASSYTFEDRNLQTGKYSYRLKQIDVNGNFEYHNLNGDVEVGVPAKFNLSQNYPNPFNPSTKIDFSLPSDGKVKITLYDITGKEVKTLVNDSKTAGYYTVQFDASGLSSGSYFYRIEVESNSKVFTGIKRMMLIK